MPECKWPFKRAKIPTCFSGQVYLNCQALPTVAWIAFCCEGGGHSQWGGWVVDNHFKNAIHSLPEPPRGLQRRLKSMTELLWLPFIRWVSLRVLLSWVLLHEHLDYVIDRSILLLVCLVTSCNAANMSCWALTLHQVSEQFLSSLFSGDLANASTKENPVNYKFFYLLRCTYSGIS